MDKTYRIDLVKFRETQEKQRQKGLDKYKNSLADADLLYNNLSDHAEEEIVDLWNYLQESRRAHEKEVQEAYVKGYEVGLKEGKKKVQQTYFAGLNKGKKR